MSDRKPSKYRRAAVITAVAAAALAISAPGATATATLPAASCSQAAPPSNHNPYSTTHTVLDPAPLRTAPYEKCTLLKTYAAGGSLTVNCYIVNDYGNTWSYVRGAGWVWDKHLSAGGSPHACVF
ncbi:hypothetical protein AB0E67_16455 [Streptomyces sp. NPDC032161]|uniref:hypothetical protein n=1 Tax=unclassified Streptomyces TaxID=2593676 RepID=UPI003405DF85